MQITNTMGSYLFKASLTELEAPLLDNDKQTELEKIFYEGCTIVWINDDREYIARCYLCLFIYIKARENGERWTFDKETIKLIRDTINSLEDKEIMEKLIEQFEKIN